MNPEVKAQWLEDLRSGNFVKGRTRLHTVDKNEDGTERHEFCCLGVLCEQAVAAGVVDRTLRGTPGEGEAYYVYHLPGVDPDEDDDAEANYLPDVVKVWAGLHAYCPRVNTDGTEADPSQVGRRVAVATLNDEIYNTFAPIADAVERDL